MTDNIIINILPSLIDDGRWFDMFTAQLAMLEQDSGRSLHDD